MWRTNGGAPPTRGADYGTATPLAGLHATLVNLCSGDKVRAQTARAEYGQTTAPDREEHRMTTSLHQRIGEVTERIARRSQDSRRRYLDGIEAYASKAPTRKRLGCANFAHGFAACGPADKQSI